MALLTDLNSTNGTFAGALPAGTRVPLKGTRLCIGDYVRFGFCPVIYRLEEVSGAADCLLEESTRDERRQQQLRFAETSYLTWLSQVREEYAAVRSRAEAAGSPMSGSPSLEELEVEIGSEAEALLLGHVHQLPTPPGVEVWQYNIIQCII